MTVYFSVISWFLRNPTYHRSILIALVNVLEGLEYVVITFFFQIKLFHQIILFLGQIIEQRAVLSV